MDSTWEVACANRLDELGIRWIRNPSLKLKYTTRGRRQRNYIPDFYLPDLDIYIEVKSTSSDQHMITVRDNGPGIVREQLPRIFAISSNERL